MKRYLIMIVTMLMMCLSISSCQFFSKNVKPTTVIVQDSIRHYYPLIQGQELYMKYRLANIGKEPFVITDIHAGAGCEVVNKYNTIILPQKEQTFAFKFTSDKFIGFVEHEIYVYGNANNNEYGMIILYFDVNVVAPTEASIDYEENYYRKEKMTNFVKQGTDGTNAMKGYYINSGDYPEDYEKNYKKYPWRERSENYQK